MKQSLILAALLLTATTSFAQSQTSTAQAKKKTQQQQKLEQMKTSAEAVKAQSFNSAQASQTFSANRAMSGMGGHDGNGGGGVVRDGRYMTFYSAGLYTEPNPLSGIGPDAPPQMDALISFVEKFPFWSPADKAILIQTTLPSEKHQYFKVKEDQFTQATMDRLLAEYSRVTHQPLQGLKVYAVTDVEQRKTYLLPGFYKLSAPDQVAILFHEDLWLIWARKASYQNVIDAEMAFEAAYMQPDNAYRALDLVSKFGDQSGLLDSMAQADLSSGALNGLLDSNNSIPFAKILGDEVVSCQGEKCVPGMMTVNLFHLVQKYPRSLILNHLLKATQTQEEEQSAFIIDLPGNDGGTSLYYKNNRFRIEGGELHIRLSDISSTVSNEAWCPRERSGCRSLTIDSLSSCSMSIKAGHIGELTCSYLDSVYHGGPFGGHSTKERKIGAPLMVLF